MSGELGRDVCRTQEVMAYTVMVCGVMDYIVMVYRVMAYTGVCAVPKKFRVAALCSRHGACACVLCELHGGGL